MDVNTGDTQSEVTQSSIQSDQSAGEPQSGSDEAASSRGASQERSSGRNLNGWLQTWLKGGGQQTTNEDPTDAASDSATESGRTSPDAATAKSDRQASTPSRPVGRSLLEGDPNETITMTRAEAARVVQSEKDRSIAAENRRNQEMAAMRASAAQLQTLRDLSDPLTGDPDKLAEVVQEFVNNRDNQEQVQVRQSEILGHVKAVANGYDLQIVTPLLQMLPEPVARKIEAEAPEDLIGLDHRVHLFNEGIRALKETWRSQVRAELRRSEAFRKEVLSGIRGDLPEPELVPATAASANGHDPNTWLRNSLRG